MKRSITTAFPPPNNNAGTPDDDTDNAPAPERVPPTMRFRDATLHPMASTGSSQATSIQDIGPISQPLLISRGQVAVTQQAPESTQEKSMQGIDVNLADQDGRTPLMLAIQYGDLPTVQTLLSHGANVNATDKDGWTPLIFAIQHGHLTTILTLLSAPGIDIDIRGSDGTTALGAAIVHGKDDVVKALINKGADVNFIDNKRWTPLIWAVECNHLATVQALLGAPGIHIDAQTSKGKTALYVAAQEGKGDVVNDLINKGADVNITTYLSWTPLIAAAQGGHLRTVQTLLSVPGIDINARNIFRKNALYVAVLGGKNDVVKVLLENGADIKEVYESIKEQFGYHNDDSDDDENHNALSASLDFLMNYLAQRQADVGDLRQEATWASAFATSAIPPKASRNTIPSLGSIALDAHIKQAQIEGSSLSQISFQASRDQLLRQTLSAVDVVKLISTFSSSPFATALVQTLAIAIKLGGYRTESEHHLIFNALRTSHLIDEYEKSKSRLNSKNINRWQVSGQTLLTRAAQAGDQMLVDVLVKCGASFHLPDQHGNNALHAAVKAHEWSVCSYLLELGANANTSDRNGISTLTYLAQAFAKGDEETAIPVAQLIAPLLAKGYRLNRLVESRGFVIAGVRTTILAILQSDLNRYGSYLDVLYADDVNLVDNDGHTPLMFAAKQGLLTVLQALMNKGANVNAASDDGWTPLMRASHDGHLTIIQALLSAPSIDIDAKKPDGETALYVAVHHGKDDAVKALINKGANVNAARNDGWSPLMYAAAGGHLTTIQALLSAQGLDIDAKKADGMTALMVSAAHGKDDVVKELINKGANFNAKRNDGWTSSMLAAEGGHLTTMQALLSAPSIDIDARKPDGMTALMVAADHGKDDIVKELIDKSADVNATDNDGWTPLMLASHYGHLTTAQALLIAPGIDIDAKKSDGATALYLAALNGNYDVAKALIDKGADVNVASNDSWTPLMYAAQQGHLTTVQALLSAPGIDIDAKKPDGLTALLIAASHDKDDAVKALIHKGANVNATDNGGWTPLMLASHYGHLTTVQALLSAPGIDIDAKKPDGITALYLAASNGKEDVVKALINKDADVNITDNHGLTPMMIANSQGYLTIVQAFFDRY